MPDKTLTFKSRDGRDISATWHLDTDPTDADMDEIESAWLKANPLKKVSKPSPQYTTSQIDAMLTGAKKQKQTSTPQMLREGDKKKPDKARNFESFRAPKPSLEQIQADETKKAQSRGIVGQLGETLKSSFDTRKGANAREKATALEQLVSDKLNILTLVARSQGAGAGADLAKGVVAGALTGAPQALSDVSVVAGRDDYPVWQRALAGGNVILSALGGKAIFNAAKQVKQGAVPAEQFIKEALKQSFGADGVEKASMSLAKKMGLLKPEVSEARLLKDAKEVIESVHADAPPEFKPKFDTTPGEQLPEGVVNTGRVDAKGKPIYKVAPKTADVPLDLTPPKPGAKRVVVNDATIDLEGEALDAWSKVDDEYLGRVASIDDQIKKINADPNLTPGQKAGFIKDLNAKKKALGMKVAAEKRKITGQLTDKEKLQVEVDAQKLQRGMDVETVDGTVGKVKTTQYGKVTIELPDGTTKTVERSQIKPRQGYKPMQGVTVPERSVRPESAPAPDIPADAPQGVSGSAIWRNADTDMPVEATGVVHTDAKTGKQYAEVLIDGNKSYVPADELIPDSPVTANPDAVKIAGGNADAVATAVDDATQPQAVPDAAPQFDMTPGTGDDVAGFAKVFTDRDPLTGISPQEVLARAKANTETGMIDPMDVITRVTSGGRAMTSDEAGATIVALREHKNKLNGLYGQLETETDPLKLNDINKKIEDLEQLVEKYQQAGDLTGNEWHRLGQALQVGLKPDYSMATIQKRLKGASLGTEVSKQDAEKIGGLAKKIRDAETRVNEQADGIVADLINEAPADSAAMRRYKEALRRFLAGEKQAADRGVGKNRQRGAAVYTLSDPERKAMAAARKVARDALTNYQYTNPDGTVGQGARDVKDVLEHLRNNGATGSDETLLRLISEPYRKYLLEADVAKLEIDKAMRDVQKAAQFQLKTKVNKALNITGEIFTTFQRAAKSGLDMSAPFVQGRKAIWVNNKAWREAWKPMIEAARKGDVVAMNQLADIKRDPMYSRAVAAGLELSEPGGRFTSQEEQFAGNFLRMLSSVNNGKGIPGLNYYIRALENSEAAFSVFLNKVRYDTFKKFASAMPDDPEYLKSVADQMNVIYGRGSGELAKRVGGLPAMGNLMYAPRYTVSKWQYATGMRGTMPPINSPARAAAEANRLKIYSAHALSALGMAGIAKAAGWKVDTDPRSTNYGKGISPDGVAVDLFGSEFEAWRLLTQIAYGKVSLTGNFTRPAGKEGEFVGKYLENKLAPVARNVKEGIGGRRDDDYKLKPMETRDWLINYAPMWLDRNAQDDNALWKANPALAILQAVGIDSSVKPRPKYGQKTTPPPKIDLLRPNVYMKKPIKL